MYHLEIGGEKKEYPKGTTYAEIAWEYQGKYEHPIMLASLNGKLRELFKPVEHDGKLEFITSADTAGHSTLVRGMIFVMMRAMYKVSGRIFNEGRITENMGGKPDTMVHGKAEHESQGGHMIERVRMEYSIGAGLYGEIDWRTDKHPDIVSFLAQVKEEMKHLIASDLPFYKKTVGTEQAAHLFHEVGMYEKEKLFGYRLVSNTNIYELDGFYDYYYGYMPKSTGVLPVFDLTAYEDGFLLLMPEKKTPDLLTEFTPRKKLYNVLKQSNRWAQSLGLGNVGDLNRAISQGSVAEMILVQEAYQEKEIAKIAEQIYARGNVKFVMIAGPTSSGKTTFSHRLSIQLRTLGLRPQPIAVDDYFVNREDTPLDENGNYNFEVLEAIDVEQFNHDMVALLRGERVELPSFNFKTGKREYKGIYKELGAEDILVIEGIHGLNDALSYALPRESKFKIYISALTQLNVDEHNRISTTDGRLIRRMVRDARTRGTAAKDTIAMWPSVRRGEEENIFPFQEDADVMFNSALIYELSVLKQFAEPLLFGIGRECAEYAEAKRLLKFLNYFLGVSSEGVPNNSILREFVGGSCFKV
ncbi:MAG: nucleoside kinase [Lachnospiraceae bacterium]|nr:nucleoside kinase [Lachnospiraceae bacterium]